MIEIEYKSNMSENIDLYIRSYWLKKSSWRGLLFSIIVTPACALFVIVRQFKPYNPVLYCSLFLIVYAIFVVYTYGPGHRRKTRALILETLNGKPLPEIFKCQFSDEGIMTDNGTFQIRVAWSSVNKIQYHKQYLELQCTGILVQIRKEHAPDISEFINLWENHRELGLNEN